MKTGIAALAFYAGLTLSAHAQSRLDLQVSLDGTQWSRGVDVDLAPGASRPVLVRALISWTGAVSPTSGPIAFSYLTWQPTFGNIRPGVDSVNPFADRGNNTNGGAVTLDDTPLDGPFGRIIPWAITGVPATGTLRYAPILHTGGSGGAPPGNFLRIARNDVTRWVGTGPTSGTAASNNFNGAGGVAFVQDAPAMVGPNDPPFESGITDKLIWQISLNVGGVATGESHTIDVLAPTDGMSRNTATGVRQASWFRDLADMYGSVKGDVTVVPASITIVPSPGTLAALSIGALFAARRRR